MTARGANQFKASLKKVHKSQDQRTRNKQKNSKFKFYSRLVLYLTLVPYLLMGLAKATCSNGLTYISRYTKSPSSRTITYRLGDSQTQIDFPTWESFYNSNSNSYCANFDTKESNDYLLSQAPVWLITDNLQNRQIYVYTEDTQFTDTDTTITLTRNVKSPATGDTSDTWQFTVQIRRTEQCQHQDSFLRTLSQASVDSTTYLIGIAPMVINLTPVTQINRQNKPCFYDMQYSYLSGKPSNVDLTFDYTSVKYSPTMTVTSSDISLHGQQSRIRIRTTPQCSNGCDSYLMNYYLNYWDDYYHDIVWQDPCAATSLSNFGSRSISNVIIKDGASPQTRTLTDPGDTVSNQYYRENMCGSKIYTIVPQDSAYNAVNDFITVTESGGSITITIAPSSPANNPTYHQAEFVAYLRVSLANYPSISDHNIQFTIDVGIPSCDCSMQPWAGTSTSLNVAVSAQDPGYLTIPNPPQDHNYSAKAAPALRQCTSTSCTNLSGNFSDLQYNGSAISSLSWITWSSSANSNGVIRLWPTSGALKTGNPYVITATWTPSVGVAITYQLYSLTITCEITHFTVSNEPSPQTYSLYQKSKVINLQTVTYTQVPACAYTFTPTYSFSGTTSQIIESTAVVPGLEVYSVDRTSFTAGSFNVIMSNSIEIGSGQGQTTTTFNTIQAVPRTTIQITLSNSCESDNVGGTDTAPTLSQSSITVNDGTTGSVELTYSMDTFENSLSSDFNLLCGPRVFTARNNADSSLIGSFISIVPNAASPNKATVTIDPALYGTLITSTINLTVRLEVTLKDYTSRAGTSVNLAVTLQPIACNCADMLWTQPAAVTLPVAVNANANIQVPEPTSDNSQAADEINHRAFANCFKSGGPGCTISGGTMGSANVKYASGVVTNMALITSSLPSWLSFSTSTYSGQIIAAPNDVSQIGTHTIKVQYDPPSGVGTSSTYIAVSVIVLCQVGSITAPSIPSSADRQYIVGSTVKIFDFTDDYVQVPNCDYPYTQTFSWTGVGASGITQDQNAPGRIFVQTDNLDHVGTHTVVLYNSYVIADNGGSSSTFTLNSGGDLVSFVITIVNPCISATLQVPNLSAGITTNDGTAATLTFSDASDDVGIGQNNIYFCGTRSFTVDVQSAGSNTALTFVSVGLDPTDSTKRIITANPQTTPTVTHAGTWNMKMTIAVVGTYSANISSIDVNFAVVVNPAACNCNLQPFLGSTATQSAPIALNSPPYTTITNPVRDTDYANKSNIALKACDALTCSTTSGVFSNPILANGAGALPSWITWSASNDTRMTFYPTAASAMNSNPYNVEITWTPTVGVALTYTAFTITVTCQVASITRPTLNLGPYAYNLFGSATEIDISSHLVYTQVPNCGYTLTSSITWVTKESWMTAVSAKQNKALSVFTVDPTHGGSSAGAPTKTFAVTFKDDLNIASNGPGGSTNFQATSSEQVSFNVVVTNQCWATSISALTFTPSTQPFAITDGQTGAVTFSRPTNGVETSVSIPMICGTTSFEVFSDNVGTALTYNWVTIAQSSTPGTYSLNIDTTVSLELIGIQSSVTHTVYVRSKLDQYSTVMQYSSFQIQINQLACDCQYVRWTNPAVTSQTAPVASTTTISVPVPTVDNSLKTSTAAYQTCFDSSDNLTCNVSGSFLAASVVMDDGTAIPSWMTFDHANGNVAVNPTLGSQNGVYNLKATWTSNEANIQDAFYSALTVTVTCTVTSFTKPTTFNGGPFTIAYTLYDSTLTTDFTPLVSTQVPTCGYAVSSSWTFADQPSFMKASGSTLAIASSTRADAASSPYSVRILKTVTVIDSQQTGTTVFITGSSPLDYLTFTITVTDPCETATFTNSGPTVTSMTVVNGQTQTQIFTTALDSVDATNVIKNLCGPRQYSIHAQTSDLDAATVSWTSISLDTPSFGQHTITLSPNDVQLLGNPVTYQLRSKLADFPSRVSHVPISIQVTPPSCNCELLTWDNPAMTSQTVNVMLSSASATAITVPLSTVNVPSKTASSAIESCYALGTPCAETFTVVMTLESHDTVPKNGAALSTTGFVTSNGSTTNPILSFKPLTPAHKGVWVFRADIDTASGPNPSYLALTITVGCIVSSIANPTTGFQSSYNYNIYEASVPLDMSGLTFQQSPDCGNVPNSATFAWTFVSGGAAVPAAGTANPITVNGSNGGQIDLFTTNLADIQTNTALRMIYTIVLTEGTFTPQITFNVNINDPCRSTVIQSVDVTTGITVRLGDTSTLNFVKATDSFENARNVDTLCGDFTYEVIDASNGDAVISWLSVTQNPNNAAQMTITANPMFESTATVGTKYYKLWIKLANYYPAHHQGSREDLTINLQDANCDCNLVQWTAPTQVTLNAAVAGGAQSISVPLATINQSAGAGISPKYVKCYSHASFYCDEASTLAVTLNDGSALDTSFLTFDASAKTVTITPTTGLHANTYILQVTQTSTNNYGTINPYLGVKIVVTCTITSINALTSPALADRTYSLYSSTLEINIGSQTITQVPPCGYPLTETVNWSIASSSPISVNSANNKQIDVVTLNKSKLGTHSVSLSVVVAYSPQSFSQTLSLAFDVIISDPCLQTSLNSVVFSPSSLTVTNGQSGSVTFSDATDAVEVAQNIDTLCGPRSVSILTTSNATPPTWIQLSGPDANALYTITATPTQDNDVTVHTIKVKTTLSLYAGIAAQETNLTINVNGASCDPSTITWIPNGTVTSTVDQNTGPTTVTILPYIVHPDSLTDRPTIRACSSIDQTFTLAATQKNQLTLPSFISQTGSTSTLTVNPTLSAHQGVYTLTITQTTVNGVSPVFDGVVITVGCTINSVSTQSAPSSSLTTYALYSQALIVDLSAYVYTQSPLCGFSLNYSFGWTIPSDGQPFISQVSAQPASISVQSNKKSSVGTKNVVMTTSITDSNENPPQTFSTSVAFTVTVTDPCDSQPINDLTLTPQTIINGQSYTWTFSDATIQIEIDNDGQQLCGPRSYRVYTDSGKQTEVSGDWISISQDASTGQWTMQASPTSKALVQNPSASLQLYLEIVLSQHSAHPKHSQTLHITVVHPACDCSLLTWDLPSGVTFSVDMNNLSANSVSIPMATPNVPSKTLTPPIERCYDTSGCDEVPNSKLLVLQNTNSLPSFMSFASDNTLTITPTLSTHIGNYPLTITLVGVSGTDPVYQAATVTVTCTITNIAAPSPPATINYNVYDSSVVVDLSSGVYVQTPDCGYSVVNSFAWNSVVSSAGALSDVSASSAEAKLRIFSNDKTHAGTFAVTLTNALSYQGVSFTPQTLSFSVVVADPCTNTSILTPTSLSPLTVINGDTQTRTFTQATLQAEVSNAGLQLCGDRQYAIVDASGQTVSWLNNISLQSDGSTYSISAQPTQDSLVSNGETVFYLKVTLANYNIPVRQIEFKVTVVAATCNCDLLSWDNPSMLTETVDVGAGQTSVTMPSRTINALSKTPSPAVRACFANGADLCTFTSTYAVSQNDNSPLPDFIQQSAQTSTLYVTPLDYTDIGQWALKVTHSIQFTSHGTATGSFLGVTIATGCTIASIPSPSPPSANNGFPSLTYTLYESPLALDLSSIAFVQVPNCNYPVTESVQWTNPEPTVIVANQFNPKQLSVLTIDLTKVAVHPLTLTNTLTYQGQTFTASYSFSVTIADPCANTTLNPWIIPPILVENGQTATYQYTDATDSVQVSKGISTLCGPRAYALTKQNGDAITWVTVLADDASRNTHTITASPTLDAHDGTSNLRLTLTLTNYSSHPGITIDFVVTVSTPVCDCSLITYDPPASQTLSTTVLKSPADTLTISLATHNVASLTASPKVRVCGNSCDTSTRAISSAVSTLTNALPPFMTLAAQTLTVAPTDNSAHLGTYPLQISMSTPDSGPVVYQTVTVTVGLCVVTALSATNAPASNLLTYDIFSLNALTLDLATPGFLQQPACGYYLFKTISWTIPPGAPITQSTTNQYAVIVSSQTASSAATYALTLTVSALHAATMNTFTNQVTFNVNVRDPCLLTNWDSLSIVDASVAAGGQYSWSYAMPNHSAGTTVSNQLICGTPTHTVFKVVAGVQTSQTFVTHSTLPNSMHQLIANNLDESHVAQQSLRLVIDLGNPNYPKKIVDFTLTVTGAACDCTLLSWVQPSLVTMNTRVLKNPVDTRTLAKAQVDAVSETASPEIRACVNAFACDKSSVVSLVDAATNALPSFMTFDTSSLVLTVTPTAAVHIGSVTLSIRQTLQTGQAMLQFQAITVNVDCIITAITPPADPGTQTYNMLANALTVSLTGTFVQHPPCGYPITLDPLVWTIPSGAPIQEVSNQPYQIRVEVSNLDMSLHQTYPVSLATSVSYNDRGTLQSFTSQVSFSVQVKDPCKATTFSAVSISDMTATLGTAAESAAFSDVADSAEQTYGADSCGARVYSIVAQGDASQTQVGFARVEPIIAGVSYKVVSDSVLEADEGVHSLTLLVTLVNYPTSADAAHPTALANFQLTINPAACDCSLLGWDTPTPALTLSTSVLKIPSDTLALPHFSVNEPSKQSSPAIRRCYRSDLGSATPCSETTSTLSVVQDGSTLPAFMSVSNDVLTVAATSNDQIGVYTLRVSHSTPASGIKSYNSITVTLTLCQITSVTPPPTPPNQTYTIRTQSTTLDLSSPGFVQVPACGYAYNSQTLVWSFSPSTPGALSGSDYVLTANSGTNSDDGVWQVTLSGTFVYLGATFSPVVSFQFSVVDSCKQTVISSLAINGMVIATGEGQTANTVQAFNEPTDSASAAIGDHSMCGPYSYEVQKQDASDQSWGSQSLVVVEQLVNAGSTHRLLAQTMLVADEGVYAMRLVVRLGSALYPSALIPFALTVNAPACDCSLLVWIPPAAQHLDTTVKKIPSDSLTINHFTPDPNSKSASPAIARCYRTDLPGGATPCDETTAIVSVNEEGTNSLNSNIVRVDSTLTVNAVSNSEVKVYVLRVIHSTVNGGNKSFNTVTINIANCLITSLTAPAAPTGQTYAIHSPSPLTINFASPGFVQVPACGYTLTETRTWTYAQGAPIVTDNDYQVSISSSAAIQRGVYTLTLSTSSLYPAIGASYSALVTFSVTVTDPCQDSQINAQSIQNVFQEAGQVSEQTLNEFTDVFAQANAGDPLICGQRTYSVVGLDINGAEISQNLVAILPQSNGTYKLRTEATDETTQVGTFQMRFKVRLPDITYRSKDIAFQVQITEPVCDCSLLQWQAPSAQTFTTSVSKIPSDSFVIAMGVVVESSKQASPKIRACYPDTPCDTTTIMTSVVESGSTFPSYFSRAANTNTITVNANQAAHARQYILAVTHSTPASGTVQYTSVTVVVEVCVITSISSPSVPTANQLAYTVHASALSITLTPQFEQVPACGYTLNQAIAWVIPPNAPISKVTDYQLSVSSSVGSDHGQYSLVVQNVVTYNGQSWSPQVSFSVEVTDPCRIGSAVIAFTPLNTMEIILGASVTQNFPAASDSVGQTYSVDVCGPKSYILFDSGTGLGVQYANVEQHVDNNGNAFRIVATSASEGDVGEHTLVMRVTFANYALTTDPTYPKTDSTFTVRILSPNCDCTQLTWDTPTKQTLTSAVDVPPLAPLTINLASVNELSKTASPTIRACYVTQNPQCNTIDFSIAVVDANTNTLDAAFMAVSGFDLTVTPNSHTQIGTYTLQVTQTTQIPNEAVIVWNAVTVTVTCTILSLSVPTAPNVSSYVINSGDVVLTTSGAFVQVPNCNYSLVETLTWSHSEQSGISLTPTANNAYQVTMNSNNFDLAKQVTLTLTMSAYYVTTVNTFTNSLSFTLEFIHPCRRSAFSSVSIPNITYQLRNGQVFAQDAPIPSDAISSSFGNGHNTCGPRTYHVYTAGTTTTPSYISVQQSGSAPNTFGLTVTSDQEGDVGVKSLEVYVEMSLYPVSADALHKSLRIGFSLTITAAVCDCALISYIAPAASPLLITAQILGQPGEGILAVAGVDPASLVATSGARACSASDCDYSSTTTAQIQGTNSIPNWMTFSKPTLTVTPTLASHVGEFIVELVQVRQSDSVTQTYQAARVVVSCIITSFIKPNLPQLAETQFTLFQQPSRITLSPAFQQVPDCGHTLQSDISWTVPDFAPISGTSDPYSVEVFADRVVETGLFTVFLVARLQHGASGADFTEIVSFDITISDACVDTVLHVTDTNIEDMVYVIGTPPKTVPFLPITDTVTANITTSGFCGQIAYTFANNNTVVGTTFLKVINLLTNKAIEVSTSNEDIAGDYLISMTATLDTGYTEPETKTFLLTLKLAQEATPDEARGGIGVSPVLLNTQTAFTLDLGASFQLTLQPFDADGDLTSLRVNLGAAASFTTYDASLQELRIDANNAAQLLGDFIVEVSLLDNQANTSVVAIILSIVCPSDSKDPQCVPLITTPIQTDSNADSDSILNVGIELIEDPDTTEIQQRIDTLQQQSTQTQQAFFQEELIPTGDIISISETEQKKLSEDQLEEIVQVNTYAREITQIAQNIRFRRQANGFIQDVPPKITVQEVTSQAKMILNLDRVLALFGDISTIQDSVSQTSRRRNLQDYQNKGLKIDVSKFMKFTLVPGEGAADISLLRFRPELSSFSDNQMEIDFVFDNPLEVSTGDTPDLIIAEFTDPRLLVDPKTGMFVQNEGMITKLPRLLLSDNSTEVLIGVCSVVSSVANVILIVAIVVAFYISAVSKSIWQLVNIVQLLAYLRFFVQWPANTQLGFECLEFSVTGRVQTDVIWNLAEVWLYGFEEYLRMNAYPTLVDTPNLFKAMGIYPLFTVVILGLMVYAGFLNQIKRASMQTRRNYSSLSKKIYYNSWLRLLLEADLKLAHQALAIILFVGLKNQVAFFSHLVLAAILVLLPFTLGVFLIQKKDALHERDTAGRFGTLYEGIRTDKAASLLYNVIFLFRRMSFVLVVLLLRENVFARVILFQLMQVFFVIYVGWTKPHVESIYNSLELFNEGLILLLGYAMALNTNFMRDNELRYQLSWAALILVFFIFVVNLVAMLVIFLVELAHAYKMFRLKRKFLMQFGRKEMIEQNYFKSSRDSGPNALNNLRRSMQYGSSSRDEFSLAKTRSSRRDFRRKSSLVQKEDIDHVVGPVNADNDIGGGFFDDSAYKDERKKPKKNKKKKGVIRESSLNQIAEIDEDQGSDTDFAAEIEVKGEKSGLKQAELIKSQSEEQDPMLEDAFSKQESLQNDELVPREKEKKKKKTKKSSRPRESTENKESEESQSVRKSARLKVKSEAIEEGASELEPEKEKKKKKKTKKKSKKKTEEAPLDQSKEEFFF